MARKKKAETDEAAEPDSVVRQTAGSYLSGDGRFEVRQSDSNWFLIDTQQTDELGQELLRGPFASLKAAREEMPKARQVIPLPRSRPRRQAASGAKKTASAKAALPRPPPPPPPPPPTWVDRLPAADATKVRRLISALEREGLSGAEALVRRDRDGLEPAVATRLIERHLDALVQDLPEKERRPARELLSRATEILTGSGTGARGPLPGWALVEIGPEPDPPNRRIRLPRS